MNAVHAAKVGILTGPTATGKTAIALEVAERLHAIEIINADSLLIYRGMDIGTAKPTTQERTRVSHHLIDIRDPDQRFTAGDFERAARAAIEEIHGRGHRALIVGGSGFYLKALLYGLWDAPPADPALRASLESRSADELYRELFARDEESALRIGRNDRYRLVRAHELLVLTGKTPTDLQRDQPTTPDPLFELWVVDREPVRLEERIAIRTREMLEQGLIDETRALLGRYPGARALDSVGYAQVRAYLQGEAPQGRKLSPGLEGLREEIQLATRQLVKRQRTWFRGEKQANWFHLDGDRAQLEERIRKVYET